MLDTAITVEKNINHVDLNADRMPMMGAMPLC
jgi:hypothetical protein